MREIPALWTEEDDLYANQSLAEQRARRLLPEHIASPDFTRSELRYLLGLLLLIAAGYAAIFSGLLLPPPR